MSYKEVFIGLGSNLGNPVKQLSFAIDSLSNLRYTKLTTVSAFYRNPPIGELIQPHYVNAVARLETSLKAEELFSNMQYIETTLGRPNRRKRWSARVIDLDLLLYGREIIDSDKLKVPHPEIDKRAFVLVPLSEIAPVLEVPGLGRVKDLVKGVDISGLALLNAGWGLTEGHILRNEGVLK